MAKKAADSAEKQTFAKRIVTYPEGLNLREGPGKDYSVKRVLKAGETVQPKGEADENGWMPVRGGWVDSHYTQEV